MKILHISGAKGWGGNEQQLIDLIPELEKLAVSNCVFGMENSILQEECKVRNISFICSKEKKLNSFLNYKYLKELIKKQSPDLIHLHTSDSLTLFTISDLIYNLKTATIFSKKGMGSSSSFLSKIKYNYKNITSIICISEKVKNDFSLTLTPKNKKKLVVIYDAVAISILGQKAEFDLREKYKIPIDSLIIGSIANHTRAKNLDTLIDTADYLINNLNIKNVYFVQIGEFSKLTEGYQNRLKEKNLGTQFIFTNKLYQAYRFNQQFDIFITTSEREGGPTSALEALFLEKPVVSTNVGIIPEVIKNGENGYISEVRNYISLAENIKNLVLDSEKRKNIVEGNRELIIKNNSSTVIAKKTLDLYLKIQ
jgi:glycosyltransferase involved in cell wall biosynthesis